MGTGAITQYIDLAQIALYVFWGFFAALIYYLHQENKREGYPLESERSGHVDVQGFPPIPRPETYLLRDGRTVTVPNRLREERDMAAEPNGAYLGAPLEPTGDPMLAGVGWSWLTEALDAHGADYVMPSGSVTCVSSESFGGMADEPPTAQLEIRASWSPVGDLTPHVEAWGELLCTAVGLPPVPEGVATMPSRRGQRGPG